MRVLVLIAILAIASVAAAQDAEAVEIVEEITETAADVVETAVDATETAAEIVEEAPVVDAYAEAEDVMLHLCMECHGDFGHDAGFKLPTTREGTGMVGVPSIQRTDLMLIDVEKPESSYLIMKLRDDDGILGKRMPIVRSLSDEQLSMFDLWVAELSEAYLASLGPEDVDAGAAGDVEDDAGEVENDADDAGDAAGDADDDEDAAANCDDDDDHDEDHK